jgi:phosphatidylglycerol:prolipoprotein diacylglycerol transferase
MIAVLLGAVALVAGAAAGGLPYFDIPTFDIPIPFVGHLPIQPFGMLVATGVLIGAEICRRYSLKYGVDDDDLRKLTGLVVITGFVGAHVFDVLAYNRDEMAEDPLLMLKLWHGISSYGGFIGGGVGLAVVVWYKRLRTGLVFDTIGVGLILGFTIGRIGCTIVHDHIGAATDFSLGFDYPHAALEARRLLGEFPGAGAITRAHNLGFYELMYLILVDILVLTLAFKRKKPFPAGFLAVLITALYAPVRFFLEFLRLSSSDPRYLGFTFAQWMSITVFGISLVAAATLIRKGKPAPLTAELGDRVGGYRDGVLAPLRYELRESTKAAAAAAERAGKDGPRPGSKKPAAKAKGGKKS